MTNVLCFLTTERDISLHSNSLKVSESIEPPTEKACNFTNEISWTAACECRFQNGGWYGI